MKRGIQYGWLLFFLSITLSVFSQTPSQEERDLLIERIEDLFLTSSLQNRSIYKAFIFSWI